MEQVLLAKKSRAAGIYKVIRMLGAAWGLLGQGKTGTGKRGKKSRDNRVLDMLFVLDMPFVLDMLGNGFSRHEIRVRSEISEIVFSNRFQDSGKSRCVVKFRISSTRSSRP